MSFDQLKDLLEAYRDVLSLPVDMLDVDTLLDLAGALDANEHFREAIATLEIARLIVPDDAAVTRRSDELFNQLPARIEQDLLWKAAEGAEPYIPNGDVVLVIGEEAIPFSRSDSADRLHQIARSYRANRLTAHAAALLPHPWLLGQPTVRLAETIDDIAYHRLVPFGPFPVTPLELVVLNVEALAPLVRRLRAATLHAMSGYVAGQCAMILARRFGLSVVFEPDRLDDPPSQRLQANYAGS